MTRAHPVLLALSLLAACEPGPVDLDSGGPEDTGPASAPIAAGPALSAVEAPLPAGSPALGDEEASAPPEDVEAPPSVSSSATIIKGLTCGLIHTLNYSTASCEGYRTSSYSAFSETVGSSTVGFSRKFQGDFGASSGNGFYAFSATSNYNVSASSTVKLPKGTVCGLGHTTNYPSAYCYDTSTLTGCPSGWTWHGVYDTSGGGAYWFWCEYQDSYSKCTSSSCYGSTSYVPQGTVCGLGHYDYYFGTCVSSTISSSSKCPSGWTFHGWYDRGASSGHGMAWCEKN